VVEGGGVVTVVDPPRQPLQVAARRTELIEQARRSDQHERARVVDPVVAEHLVDRAQEPGHQVRACRRGIPLTGPGQPDGTPRTERLVASHRAQATVLGGVQVGAGRVEQQHHVGWHAVEARDERSRGEGALHHGPGGHRLRQPERAGDRPVDVDAQPTVGRLPGRPDDLVVQLLQQPGRITPRSVSRRCTSSTRSSSLARSSAVMRGAGVVGSRTEMHG
jgi:hypothetical protein